MLTFAAWNGLLKEKTVLSFNCPFTRIFFVPMLPLKKRQIKRLTIFSADLGR